MFLYSRWI